MAGWLDSYRKWHEVDLVAGDCCLLPVCNRECHVFNHESAHSLKKRNMVFTVAMMMKAA